MKYSTWSIDHGPCIPQVPALQTPKTTSRSLLSPCHNLHHATLNFQNEPQGSNLRNQDLHSKSEHWIRIRANFIQSCVFAHTWAAPEIEPFNRGPLTTCLNLSPRFSTHWFKICNYVLNSIKVSNTGVLDHKLLCRFAMNQAKNSN